MLDAFRARHAVDELVVIADAGMLSAANLAAVEDAGFGFIVGSRTSSAPHDLTPHFERRLLEQLLHPPQPCRGGDRGRRVLRALARIVSPPADFVP